MLTNQCYLRDRIFHAFRFTAWEFSPGAGQMLFYTCTREPWLSLRSPQISPAGNICIGIVSEKHIHSAVGETCIALGKRNISVLQSRSCK